MIPMILFLRRDNVFIRPWTAGGTSSHYPGGAKRQVQILLLDNFFSIKDNWFLTHV